MVFKKYIVFLKRYWNSQGVKIRNKHLKCKSIEKNYIVINKLRKTGKKWTRKNLSYYLVMF